MYNYYAYYVRPGDTILSIAEKNNITTLELMWFNNLLNPILAIGQKLMVPQIPEAPASSLNYSRAAKQRVADLPRDILNSPAPGVTSVEVSSRIVALYGNSVPGYITVKVKTTEPMRGYVELSSSSASAKIILSRDAYSTDHTAEWSPTYDNETRPLPQGEYTLKLVLYKKTSATPITVPLGKLTIAFEPNPKPLIEDITVSPAIFKIGGDNQISLQFKVTRPATVKANARYFGTTDNIITINQQMYQPGTYTWYWNGKDQNGHYVGRNRFMFVIDANERAYNYPDKVSESFSKYSPTFLVPNRMSDIPEDQTRKVVGNIALNQNVLSPNGDGIQDTVTGSITLNEKVSFWLYVDNALKDPVGIALSMTDAAPGTYSFTWDGKEMYGRAFPNGEYSLEVDIYQNGAHGYLNFDDKKITITGSDQIEPMLPIQNVRVTADFTQMEMGYGFGVYYGIKGDVYPVVHYMSTWGPQPTYLVKIADGVAAYVKVGDVEWMDIDKLPQKWGRITTADTALRKEPDDMSPLLQRLPVGEYVRTLEKYYGWHRVVLSSGKQGYVSEVNLTETEAPAQPGTGDIIVHTVISGDSLWKIAQKYGVSIDIIVKTNNLNINNPLYIGQKLNIPTKPPVPVPPADTTGTITYTVKSGDNLYKIGLLYGVTPNEIAVVNHILVSAPIYIGEKLLIPKVYKVVSGDSLWKVAAKFNTTIQNLAVLNQLDMTKPLYVGQRLIIGT